MKPFESIRTTEKNGIFYLTIERPDQLNALNYQVLEEIDSAMDFVYKEPSILGVIITGSGVKAFVAGADIKELGSLDETKAVRLSKKGHRIFNKIEQCPKPVIAAVNGFALGGGCELAMACHIRIASGNAKFGQPEVNLGIVPGYGGTQRLAQLIGKGRALQLLMTADFISADEAFRIGLVNQVIPMVEDLIPGCELILQKIFKKAPLAIAKVIECVNAHFDKGKDGYEIEALAFGHNSNSEDFKEGIDAFLQKREAKFKGK